MKRKRIGIVGLLHESNTFVEGTTTLADFEADLLLEGECIRDRMRDSPHEIGGFLQVLEDSDLDAVPLFLARALPYGPIESATFDELVDRLIGSIREKGPFDGILAAPHGATVAENNPDADGYWLSSVREAIGADVPLIATIDPHANLSEEMVKATDAIVAYSTNPHLDQRGTGIKAASLMVRSLAGEITPRQVAVYPDMAINIQSQNTSEEPLLSLYNEAKSLAASEKILSHSIVLGFPYADVAEMGSAVLVVSDGDSALAETTVSEIAEVMWRKRESFEPEFLSVEEAVRSACKSKESPIVLLDMGDNVGGGSPADSTAIALEWLRSGSGAAFVCLHDISAVEAAIAAGEGGEFVGMTGDSDNPVSGSFRVLSLHEGRFSESEARHGGFTEFDQGKTAVLETEDGKLTLMVTSRRMAPFSLSQLTSFGVDPSRFDMIIAKGVIAPMAAYEPIATGGFLHVDSPGVTRANMRKLSFRNRRQPMYPFESE